MYNISDFLNFPENKKIGYFVYKENTLGYLYRIENFLHLGILNSSLLLGGYNWRNGDISVNPENLRLATIEDFKKFRVCPKYHIV